MRSRTLVMIAYLATSCVPATPAHPAPERTSPRLARFMREMVGIPYAFAVLASDRPGRESRIRHAAVALHEAVHDLVHWTDPPVESDAARGVFVAYATSLEQQVEELAATRDTTQAAQSLEGIRRTCNHCHRYFRPASRTSPDVAIDLFAQRGDP